MLWTEVIPISEEIYVTSGPAMRICRIFGLFPVIVQREGNRLLLKWSPLYAMYSYIFGLSVIILTYWGYFVDVLVGREKSIRMKTDTDVYVTFTDVSASVLVHTFGIFVTSLKYSTFCKYVQCIYKVDSIISQSNLKSARNFSIFVMTFILGGLFIILTTDMLMYFKSVGPKTGNIIIVKCYTAYYVAYHVAYCHKFLFWHLATCILRRIQRLNEHLEFDNFVIFATQNLIVKHEYTYYIDEMFNHHQQINKDSEMKNPVIKLMQVYGSLCDASESLNKLLGINMAITLIGILWHLILVPYFLITGITRDGKDITFILMQAVWVGISIGRLIFIVQPCYNCETEVQKTKDLVCKLVSSPDIDDALKLQLQDFSILLQLRNIEFTTSGLIGLDRTLVASMVGSATTHLVVLLQAGGWNSALSESSSSNSSHIMPTS